MTDDYKTLRVPEDDWETAKEQKEAAGRTWGDQIVRPDGGVGNLGPFGGEVPEGVMICDAADEETLDAIREQLDRIESSAETAEQRAGSIERLLEGLQG